MKIKDETDSKVHLYRYPAARGGTIQSFFFPDFYGFQISGGTDYLTGTAAITF
jgi:hypothetical protein